MHNTNKAIYHKNKGLMSTPSCATRITPSADNFCFNYENQANKKNVPSKIKDRWFPFAQGRNGELKGDFLTLFIWTHFE